MFNRTFRWPFPEFYVYLLIRGGNIVNLVKQGCNFSHHFPLQSCALASHIFLNSNYSCSSLLTQFRQDLSDHPVPNRVKLSFVIFDIRDSGYTARASECPDVKNYK